jgi:hypothetical protein
MEWLEDMPVEEEQANDKKEVRRKIEDTPNIQEPQVSAHKSLFDTFSGSTLELVLRSQNKSSCPEIRTSATSFTSSIRYGLSLFCDDKYPEALLKYTEYGQRWQKKLKGKDK